MGLFQFLSLLLFVLLGAGVFLGTGALYFALGHTPLLPENTFLFLLLVSMVLCPILFAWPLYRRVGPTYPPRCPQCKAAHIKWGLDAVVKQDMVWECVYCGQLILVKASKDTIIVLDERRHPVFRLRLAWPQLFGIWVRDRRPL